MVWLEKCTVRGEDNLYGFKTTNSMVSIWSITMVIVFLMSLNQVDSVGSIGSEVTISLSGTFATAYMLIPQFNV